MLRQKKSKHFLEQKEALQLAASIAGVQEDKALSKAKKHHQTQPGDPQPERIPKVSTSKSKIKETKAIIVAQRARSKKAKAKLRRGIISRTPSVPEQERAYAATSQKRVSFV